MTFTDAQKWAVFMIHLEVKNNLRVSGLGTKCVLLAYTGVCSCMIAFITYQKYISVVSLLRHTRILKINAL